MCYLSLQDPERNGSVFKMEVKHCICCVVGTRPEAIKMAPVIRALKEEKWADPFVLATGQHMDMLRQALCYFGIRSDLDLSIMKENQTLDYITTSVLLKVGEVLDELKPSLVLVHGDTTTTMAASLAAFYRNVPIGHVEAGLRSGNIRLPFPEELNRIIADRTASIFFAPTEGAKKNLIAEGAPEDAVLVTGNTVIDALKWTMEHTLSPSEERLLEIPAKARILLVTAHRRESLGKPLVRITNAVSRIVSEHEDLWAVVPMHKNPEVRKVFQEKLGRSERVLLCDPLGYPDFVWIMKKSTLVLTDSGGIQEETTYLGVPTLVMRDVTERPEAVSYGTAFLVGTDENAIAHKAKMILSEEIKPEFGRKKGIEEPFGEGLASRKIIDGLADFLKGSSVKENRFGN
ncbi:MAG: UDP-N-acetylglucosamine 2-epimerase [Synergistales bacterium 53_16]|jgi:UDP-N-acetylglucosamine 2-epimerase (non-hydrolysing)|nr:MAG: UDP-N-acetylglucosamine 2-epimerase [Synergistales bacterium 53_16]